MPDSAFRYGNSGRNILDGPNADEHQPFTFQMVPARRARQGPVPLGDLQYHQSHQPQSADVNIDKANAGTITKAKAARVMQLGLRVEF